MSTPEHIRGEVLSEEEYIKAAFDNAGVESALGDYLDSVPSVGEHDITERLAVFSSALAEAATGHNNVDINLIRFGFERLTHSMNEVCSQRFGYERPKNLIEAALIRLDFKQPQPGRYVRSLDDRYWTKQFSEDYTQGILVRRDPNENGQEYLTRYIRTAIHGFLFAPFTYMAG